MTGMQHACFETKLSFLHGKARISRKGNDAEMKNKCFLDDYKKRDKALDLTSMAATNGSKKIFSCWGKKNHPNRSRASNMVVYRKYFLTTATPFELNIPNIIKFVGNAQSRLKFFEAA